jgi:hypothetical protein
MVCTKPHRNQLTALLDREWVNWRTAQDEGRLVMMDAQDALNLFMLNGRPDAQRFRATMGELVSICRLAARSQHRGLTVSGEAVGLLWEEGNKDGAFQLEQLWNRLLADRAFDLHCAYPKASFNTSHDLLGMHSICDQHTEVIDRSDEIGSAATAAS